MGGLFIQNHSTLLGCWGKVERVKDVDGEYGLRLDLALSFTIERFPINIAAVHIIIAVFVCQRSHISCPLQ
jgi:hypothetical protein